MVLLSQILGAYDGSSGCQRGKRLNDQHIDGIHQRNCGDRGRSHIAHHHGVHRTHQGIQKLFHNNGDQQGPQHFVCKKMFLFHIFPLSFFQNMVL